MDAHSPGSTTDANPTDSHEHNHPDPTLSEAADPSPASTSRPPPATETDPSRVDTLDERVARAKDGTKPLRLDTSVTTTMSDAAAAAASSLPTPTSPAVPPRPASRPSSRPPSMSRRASVERARSRSPSTTSIDPKRLSVASNGSPRTQDGAEPFAMPPSPLGPSRRTSSHDVHPDSVVPSTTTTVPEDDTATVAPWEVAVVVRDWAYPPSDPRHLGFPHPDLVGPSSEEDDDHDHDRSFRRRSGGFRKSQRTRRGGQAEEDDDDEDRRHGLGLGSPIDRASRDGRASLLLGHGTRGGGDGGPSPSSTSSFSWGFVTSHATDFPSSSPASSSIGGEVGPSGYSFHDADHHDDYGAGPGPGGGGGGGTTYYSNGQHEREIEQELGLGEFVPGVYQAVYEFVPELDTEMKLSVGEWVSVFERQCAGWVQAGRIVDGVLTEEVGLVPENYLHRLDFDEGDGELTDPDQDLSSTTSAKLPTSEESSRLPSAESAALNTDEHDREPGTGRVDGSGDGDEAEREDKETTPVA
ncbi:hypothetical protein JCM11491_003802 [Sporobolomyces phaffii]